MVPPQLRHNLPHHFTVILLRTVAWLASQVGIHAIFIREKIHGTTQRLRIYFEKNNNDTNKSHPLVKAWHASRLPQPACGGFVATFSSASQMVLEELFSYLIMLRWPLGNRAAERCCRPRSSERIIMLPCMCGTYCMS